MPISPEVTPCDLAASTSLMLRQPDTVLTRKIASSIAAVPHSDSVGFNGNEKGYFPALGTIRSLECVATGELEKSILSVIK